MFNRIRERVGLAIAGKSQPRLNSRVRSYGGSSMINYLKINTFGLDDRSLAFATAASVYAYVCMDLRARAIGNAKWKVYVKGRDYELTQSPFHATVDWARQRYDQSLLYNHEMALSIWGVNYEEKLTLDNGQPGGLRWLNPIAITPYIVDGEVQYYEYTSSWGKSVIYYKHELLVNKYPNPSDDNYSLSPMMLALRSVNVDEQAARLILSFYANDAMISGVLTNRQGSSPLTEVDQKRLIQQWNDQTKGVNTAFGTVVLPHALEFQQMSVGIPDYQDKLDEGTRRKICAAFGVPMAIVDAAQVSDPLSAGSTMDSKRAQWYEEWWDGELLFLEEHYNTGAFPWLSPWAELRFSREKLQSVIRSTPAYTNNVMSRYTGGGLTFNEMREKFGDPTIPGGDWLLIPAGSKAVTKDNIASVPELTQQATEPVFSIGPTGQISTLGTPLSLQQPTTPRSMEHLMKSLHEELNTWEKFALKRAGKAVARPFKTEVIPASLADDIQAELTAAGADADPGLIKSIFDAARTALDDPALAFPALIEAFKDAAFDAQALADMLERIDGDSAFQPLLDQLNDELQGGGE